MFLACDDLDCFQSFEIIHNAAMHSLEVAVNLRCELRTSLGI